MRVLGFLAGVVATLALGRWMARSPVRQAERITRASARSERTADS